MRLGSSLAIPLECGFESSVIVTDRPLHPGSVPFGQSDSDEGRVVLFDLINELASICEKLKDGEVAEIEVLKPPSATGFEEGFDVRVQIVASRNGQAGKREVTNRRGREGGLEVAEERSEEICFESETGQGERLDLWVTKNLNEAGIRFGVDVEAELDGDEIGQEEQRVGERWKGVVCRQASMR